MFPMFPPVPIGNKQEHPLKGVFLFVPGRPIGVQQGTRNIQHSELVN